MSNHSNSQPTLITEAESNVIFMFTAIALRQARRDRQLVSRRLLPAEDEVHAEVTIDTNSGEQVGQGTR